MVLQPLAAKHTGFGQHERSLRHTRQPALLRQVRHLALSTTAANLVQRCRGFENVQVGCI